MRADGSDLPNVSVPLRGPGAGHCSHSRVPDGSSAVGDGGLLITETSVFTKLQQPKDNCSGTEQVAGAGRLGAAGAGGRRARRPALHGDARVVRVRLAPRRLVQDGLGQLGERAVDVDVGLRRRLHEPDAVLARYLQS